ncbi:hypothetical protein, partial [Bartonella sp. CL42QHWL]|uniref:hypothetical protein n=1 Tax=Bartonella sp. CL42QHWL TaxID=3243528 RepID=UPI0035D08336
TVADRDADCASGCDLPTPPNDAPPVSDLPNEDDTACTVLGEVGCATNDTDGVFDGGVETPGFPPPTTTVFFAVALTSAEL